MKNTFKIMMALASVAAAFISCSKETATPEVIEQDEIQVSIQAGSPVTKTMISGSTPYWCDGDAIGVSKQTDAKNAQFNENSIGAGLTAETATFNGTVTSTGTYYAYYPYTSNGVGAKGAKVDIPLTQHPSPTSFDGAADVMVSKSFTISTTEATTINDLEFARLGAIVKVVLIDDAPTYDLSSEEPSSVSITAPENIVGRVYVDMVNQELGELYYNQSKTVTAEYTSDKFAINGTNGAYFVVYPQTLAADETLTISATTDNYVISKDITIPAGGIVLEGGSVTVLKISLADGNIAAVSNGAALPFEDDFSWQTGTGTNAISFSSDPALPSAKYSAFATLFRGNATGVVRMSTGSATGYLTTVELDLSSAFYVHINAKAWSGSELTKIYVNVDEGAAQEIQLKENYDDYYVNFAAATKKSKVKVTTESNKRAYFAAIDVISGTYVLPPVINVTTDNPMAVENTASSQTIEYTINNPTAATLTAALQDPADTWISNIDYSTDGEVTFDVAAQSAGDSARSAVIVLSYTGAPDVEVTVNQAAGAGGTTTKTFTIASADVVTNSSYAAYNTTVNTRDWVITFGGNNKSVGTNSSNRSKCTLSSYSKYAVSPVTTSSIASAFASKTSLSNVSKISYTISGGSNQTSTNVYLLYSSNNSSFSQISLTKGTQGATIASGTEFEFAECSGYFAVLFVATNSSGNWRIDDVNLTFTYTE